MSRAASKSLCLIAMLALVCPPAGAADKPAAPAASTAAAKAEKPAKSGKPEKSDKNSLSDRLRPTGPVTVTATNVDWAKGGTMVYTGEVKLSSDTLRLDGDRLELDQLGGGEFRARVTGAPAHLFHDGEPAIKGGKQAPEPAVTARAKTLVYDSKSGLVDVSGDALVTRGEDEITGETIRYNVIERRIQAAGGNKGQVKIVIQPPPKEKTDVPSKPETPLP